MREIRRRTRVAGAFPDDSALRIKLKELASHAGGSAIAVWACC